MDKIKSPMLATEHDPRLLRFPLLASPKIDGIRCHIHDGVALSRSGKPIRNKYIQSIIGKPEFNGFDGELVVGDRAAPDVYNRTSSGVMSVDGEPNFTFVVFDTYAIHEWPYKSRHGFLSTTFAFDDRVQLLIQTKIDRTEELDLFEGAMLTIGYEGIMLRDPESPYKFGRSSAKEGYLLKVKRFAHDEAKIIGFEELMHNANEAEKDELGRTKRSQAKDGLCPSGMLGAYICESPDYAMPFNVSCGSMSHDERRQSLQNSSNDLNKIIRFKHLPHGAKDRPRHPLFAGFRDKDDL